MTNPSAASSSHIGAIAYDQRIYTFKNGLDRVSLLAIDGRMTVSVRHRTRTHRGRLEGTRGQADLVYRKGKLYLFVTVEVPDGSPIDPEGWLGVHLGIRNLAFDSDGEPHSGEHTLAASFAHRQAPGRSSVGRYQEAPNDTFAGSEGGSMASTPTHKNNHVISKSIVRKAKDTGRGIAVEDLKGIRDRVTVQKAQRTPTLHSWSFFQLRAFLNYKAVLAGVALVAVDPRNTSRTCPECEQHRQGEPSLASGIRLYRMRLCGQRRSCRRPQHRIQGAGV